MSERNRLRPSTTPKTIPSTTPMTKPRMVSSKVTTTCSHNGPCAVPCVTHVTSWTQIPEGWPQKKGSMMPVREPSSQPPMSTTNSRTRSVLISSRRRLGLAVLLVVPPELSGVTTSSSISLLCAFIANDYLVAKVFPYFMIQLDEARLEADFRHIARTWQVDGVDPLDRGRPCREYTYTVGQRNSLLQVV